MVNQFKVVIINRNIYREIDIPFNVASFSVGTEMECNYRLRKELFFEDIRLDFYNTENGWSLMCSDNLYITVGDSRKLLNMQINHGDVVTIRYQESNNDVFALEFKIDFDSAIKNYERRIDVSQANSFTIGANDKSNIILKSQYIYGDQIDLVRHQEGFRLSIINSGYGLYHNGNRAVSNEIIKDGDFFSVSDFSFYYRNGSLWTEIRDDYKVSGLNYKDYPVMNNYPRFNRNTRMQIAVDDKEIEILDPPAKPQKPKNHLFMSLMPALGMLLTAALMVSMGGAMIIMSALSAVMAIITTVMGMVVGNKDFNKDSEDRILKYTNYITNKETEIQNARNEERKQLEKKYISIDKEIANFENFSSDLFDRSPKDEDFLHVRIGTGTKDAIKKINYKKQEKLEIEDDLQEIPEKLCKAYEKVANVPIVCNLVSNNAVGIYGRENFRYEFLKNIVTDISARQFFADVKLFMVVDESHASYIDIFRFSPFLANKEIGTRNIICDEESKKVIFEYLYNCLSEREKQGNDNKKLEREHLILFFYDLCGFMQHPISRFVKNASALNVTFIFFGDTKSDIPMGCGQIIELNNQGSGILYDVTATKDEISFVYDSISDAQVNSISQKLACVKTEEISLEGSLTKNISLFTLLNIFGVEDLNLQKRWGESEVYKSMGVPLGVSKTGVVNLDLHDKAHGPHGLVAGTTGSGKSEILQTYILSIATYFHPYEIAFVIIDFKGGGMVNQFRDLPHLLGAITNIDGKEIDRSLKSIKAELQKRQRLFAEAEVNHIDKYIRKFKSGEAKEPLPHLIIIVDEFAELKAEQPEFMKELISAARIGRSLGVHLILATQKPAGQVDEQIWSNSRFKLCLKVQGPEDSNEVLKSPLAAEIKEPGRAYLQVGNNEIFELFQSAYSGESEKAVDNFVKPFKVAEVAPSGKRSVVFEQKKIKSEEQGRTQLDAVVEYVHDYCDANGIIRLPSICLPSLEKHISYQRQEPECASGMVDIGIYDDPDSQYQGSTWMDIQSQNTFILGSAQYGKTNLLQLMIREIAEKNTVEQANIYIFDFGSMVLKNFEKLNHVGGVVCASDDEKFNNLFKLLLEEIGNRKEKIVSVGVSSYAAYCEAGYTDLPHIYVFVDNFTAMNELYLDDNDCFLVLLREGISAGITCVVANSSTAGVNYRYLSNFANKVVLYCNDTGEYSAMFERPKLQPDNVQGRAIVEIDKQLLECQTYLAFEGEKEHERSEHINVFIEEINAMNLGMKAKQIPFIPSLLTKDMLYNSHMAENRGYELPVGLLYEEVIPAYLDFASLGAIGISGKEGTGHYNFVSYVLNTLNDNRRNYPANVYIIDDVKRRFLPFSNLEIVRNYTYNRDDVRDIIMDVYNVLSDRYDEMFEETKRVDNSLQMIIINNNDAASEISSDMDLMDNYREIVSRFKSLNVCIMFTNYPNQNISYDAPEPLQMIRQERHLMYFGELNNLKVLDVPYDEMRRYKKKHQIGEAFYINDNELTKLKIVRAEDGE